MRLVLVPNPELGERTPDYEPILPLGLLSLAAVLAPVTPCDAEVIDPREVDFRPPQQTAELILARTPDVVGFSTMCNTYPHALRTAELLKRARPDLTIVFGGPHASVVAEQTLDHFPWIDFILQGECERSILDFVAYLCTDEHDRGSVPGLVLRRNGAAVLTCPTYPVVPPDELPTIDYALFPRLEEFRGIPLDVGRGCPFACTFCTTNIYFERRYRLRSSAYVIATVKELQQKHGVRRFNFVHDNFTAAPRRVAEFCRDIIASGLTFEWRCSARPDSVDSDLLDLMYAAGCRSVFMGLESGSPRIQQLCLKKVRLERAVPAVRKAFALGMGLTASFITGFPYEQPEDVEQTLRLMASLNYEARTRCDLQLHLLSPVPGAPLTTERDVAIALDDVTSDVSEAAGLDRWMQLWIRDIGPPIFESFYHYLNPAIARAVTVRVRLGWFTLFNHLKLTALALEEARRRDPFTLFELFAAAPSPPATGDSAVSWCVGVVRSFLAGCGRPWADAVADVLRFEALVHHLRLSGGGDIFACAHDVPGWSDHVLEGHGVPGLPAPVAGRFLVFAESGTVRIARLSGAPLRAVQPV